MKNPSPFFSGNLKIDPVGKSPGGARPRIRDKSFFYLCGSFFEHRSQRRGNPPSYLDILWLKFGESFHKSQKKRNPPSYLDMLWLKFGGSFHKSQKKRNPPSYLDMLWLKFGGSFHKSQKKRNPPSSPFPVLQNTRIKTAGVILPEQEKGTLNSSPKPWWREN